MKNSHYNNLPITTDLNKQNTGKLLINKHLKDIFQQIYIDI